MARTANRSVLGVMNEFRFLADTHVKLDRDDPMVAPAGHDALRTAVAAQGARW